MNVPPKSLSSPMTTPKDKHKRHCRVFHVPVSGPLRSQVRPRGEEFPLPLFCARLASRPPQSRRTSAAWLYRWPPAAASSETPSQPPVAAQPRCLSARPGSGRRSGGVDRPVCALTVLEVSVNRNSSRTPKSQGKY
ncbi:uncharacterized protein PS065_000857 [Dugong dugon]